MKGITKYCRYCGRANKQDIYNQCTEKRSLIKTMQLLASKAVGAGKAKSLASDAPPTRERGIFKISSLIL